MVYQTARSVLDPNSLSNYQKYSEEEHANVLELFEVHGPNWKLIGQLVGRLDGGMRMIFGTEINVI